MDYRRGTAMWTYKMDSDKHLTIYRNRKEVWSGSYEAFMADGDICPPGNVVDQIHDHADRLDGAAHCPDCGAIGESKGHQTCAYPN